MNPACSGQLAGTLAIRELHDPESGAYIDPARSDFIFFGFDEIVITAVSTFALWYAYGGLLFDSGVVDFGQTAYAGTLLLGASDVDALEGEACGSFVLTFIPDLDFTFLTTPLVDRFETSLVPQIAPLTINIGEDGTCIYSDRTCTESCEVPRGTCATTGGLWTPGGSCPDRPPLGDGKPGPRSGSRDE